MDIQVRLIAKKVFLVLMALVLSVTAGQAWANADKSGQSISAAAVTNHTISLKGRTISYSATAGFIPICSKTTGAPEGEIFLFITRKMKTKTSGSAL